MQLKNGDIFFVNKGNKWGDLVGWFQGNKYHHVGIVIRLFAKVYVFEALAQGMVFTPLEKYEDRIKKKGYNICIKRLKDEGFEKVNRGDYASICLPLTAVGYEFKNLVGFQAIRFAWFKLFKKNIWVGRKQSVKNNRMICSELVAYIYYRLFGMFKDDWHKVAPSDIFFNDKFKTIHTISNENKR